MRHHMTRHPRRSLDRRLAAAAAFALLLAVPTPDILARDIPPHACPDGSWTVRCALADCGGMEDVYQQDLEGVTRWLIGLGFEGLLVENVAQTCKAHISNETFDPETGTHSRAVYKPGVKQLHLRPDLGSDLGEARTETEWNDALRDLYVPVHEVFHAVQEAYAPEMAADLSWIDEGTAEAVTIAYVTQAEPSNRFTGSVRRFDRPLHRPDIEALEDYDTSPFWLLVGKRLGSPGQVGYLRDVFLELGNDRSGTGLPAVDAGLAPYGGLHGLLPWTFTELPWSEATFGSAEDLGKVRLEPGKAEDTWTLPDRRPLRVQEVAGRWMRLEVDPGSPDRPVELVVWIEAEEGAADLHLLVDKTLATSATARHSYRALLEPGEPRSLEILVANVAAEAVASEPRDFRIGVRLEALGGCSMSAQVSGAVNGNYQGDVAHFSTEGAATIYGTFSNPEGVVEMMQQMADWMEEMTGEEVDRSGWEIPEDERLPRETLGISALDMVLDGTEEQHLATLAGGFRMELSVIGTPVEEGFTGDLPISHLRVVPGPRAESTFDQVPFVWAEGQPGNASLEITHFDGGMLSGRVRGHLLSDGYYDPATGDPVAIDVAVQFVALPGPTGCMTGAMGLF